MPAWSNRRRPARSAISPSWSMPRATGCGVIYSAQGGVDIEQSGAAQGRLCPPHAGAVAEALAELIADEPDAVARPCRGGRPQRWRTCSSSGNWRWRKSIRCSFRDAGCVAGDAKLVVDLSAVERQPRIAALIEARPHDLRRCQPQAARGLRLRRGRPGGRDRPGHHRRRPVDDADRRTDRARQQAAELLRHPHRPDARQSGAR